MQEAEYLAAGCAAIAAVSVLFPGHVLASLVCVGATGFGFGLGVTAMVFGVASIFRSRK